MNTSPISSAVNTKETQKDGEERQRIVTMLNRNNWNRPAVAQKLGMNYKTFMAKLTELGIGINKQ